MPGMGTQAPLATGDTQAFAAVLYPAAEGGVSRLTGMDTEYPAGPQEYSAAGFLFAVGGTTLQGLAADAPNAATAFAKPFSGACEAGGEVLKDGGLPDYLPGIALPVRHASG
jgi:hypothetical protein